MLVAEDNEINQMLVTEVLTSAGYQVEVVGDGAQALDARFREEFDLILMDCQMPVMDGFLAARAIREGETARQIDPIPIIALTANAIEGDRDGCLAAGMDDYVSKPYSASGLVSAIERLRTRPEAPLR